MLRHWLCLLLDQEVLVRISDLEAPGIDAKAVLAQGISRFLRSLEHFPRGPLPFPLETYRDFFVLVAHSRSSECLTHFPVVFCPSTLT